jgi:hypothetical protein
MAQLNRLRLPALCSLILAISCRLPVLAADIPKQPDFQKHRAAAAQSHGLQWSGLPRFLSGTWWTAAVALRL